MPPLYKYLQPLTAGQINEMDLCNQHSIGATHLVRATMVLIAVGTPIPCTVRV